MAKARVWNGIAALRRSLIAIDELAAHPSNPRRHDLTVITESLEAFGQQRPIITVPAGRVDPDRPTIIAGHGTTQAAAELGWTHIAHMPSDLTDDQIDRYVLIDNRSSDRGGYDDTVLAKLLADVNDRGGLAATGYDRPDLDSLLADLNRRPRAGKADPEVVPEPPVKAKSQLGEVYDLGPHRLLCGDAFNREAMDRLTGGDRADAVFIDPPYAIYGSSSGLSASITDDKIVRPFFRDALATAQERTRLFAPVFVCCDWRSWPSWWEVAKLTRVEPKNLIVWDKGGAGLGNNFANAYELMGYFIHLPEQKVMTQGRKAGIRPVLKPNIIRAARVPSTEREHNAAKPVALIGEILESATEPGELVLDYFAGSGSTLIACEQAGRRCLLVDIDPHYCDVVRRRYAEFVGQPDLAP